MITGHNGTECGRAQIQSLTYQAQILDLHPRAIRTRNDFEQETIIQFPFLQGHSGCPVENRLRARERLGISNEIVRRESQERRTVEIWPLGVHFGGVLALEERSRTMINNQGSGI